MMPARSAMAMARSVAACLSLRALSFDSAAATATARLVLHLPPAARSLARSPLPEAFLGSVCVRRSRRYDRTEGEFEDGSDDSVFFAMNTLP